MMAANPPARRAPGVDPGAATMTTVQQPVTPSVTATPQQHRAMRLTVFIACFGALGDLALTNGLLLVYLTSLGISGGRVLLYLSIPNIIVSLTQILIAYWADCSGKKKTGFPGTVVTALGFLVVFCSGFFTGVVQEGLTVAGIVTYSVGLVLIVSSWFALLSPIVPESMRGRYFGQMRVSWQVVNILFVAVCATYLNADSPAQTFQMIFGAIVVALVVRVVLYGRLPEMEKPSAHGGGLRQVVSYSLRSSGYAPFCAYAFLLSLCTTAGPMVFGLMEKQVLHFGDSMVVWMANLTMVGAVAGFAFGGKAVDRFGTKPVFLTCHMGFAIAMAMFPLRSALPISPVPLIAFTHLLYGVVAASSSIAFSTEMLALIPPDHKSVSTSVYMTMARLGTAFGGVLAAAALDSGMLAESWMMGPMTLSRYDTVLLGWAVAVLLLVATLGLVPSVIGKSSWMPKGSL
jgi:MFS family permease